MVKFQLRWINKRYKKNQLYRYKTYLMVFPVGINQKIEPKMRKDFEIVFTAKETATKEPST